MRKNAQYREGHAVKNISRIGNSTYPVGMTEMRLCKSDGHLICGLFWYSYTRVPEVLKSGLKPFLSNNIMLILIV